MDATTTNNLSNYLKGVMAEHNRVFAASIGKVKQQQQSDEVEEISETTDYSFVAEWQLEV